jgi:hypothetical protein
MPPALLAKTTCPNCWHQFEPHEVLWVASHPGLRGDVRLGIDAHRRFLPSRFGPEGGAIDAMGAECTQLACPRCHLLIPRVCLEAKPWFVSVFGAPASGKSYFLTAMTWALRRRLPELFRVGFTDSDATTNQLLAGYEEPLFFNPTPDAEQPLGQLIVKTKEQGDQYNFATFGAERIQYPQPFLFTIRPQEGHPQADDPDAVRVMCLYDNAGESFLAGRDSPTNPVTRHLAESALLLFLFDPVQHPPFRRRLETSGVKVASDIRAGTGVTRQDMIITEAAGRVRRFARLRDGERLDRPLVVVVTKKDVWGSLVPELAGGDLPIAATRSRNAALNLDRIAEQSQAIRKLLFALVPEVVTAAEGLSASVTYVGASALGITPTEDEATKQWMVRPVDLKPEGVELPVLIGLQKCFPQLIAGGRRAAPSSNGGKRA